MRYADQNLCRKMLSPYEKMWDIDPTNLRMSLKFKYCWGTFSQLRASVELHPESNAIFCRYDISTNTKIGIDFKRFERAFAQRLKWYGVTFVPKGFQGASITWSDVRPDLFANYDGPDFAEAIDAMVCQGNNLMLSYKQILEMFVRESATPYLFGTQRRRVSPELLAESCIYDFFRKKYRCDA